MSTKHFIHSDIQEHDQSKQVGFGIGNFDFSRHSAFIMPDVNYGSKNQKGVMKAGVSSGVQIVTQSDISHLNRDLKRAREVVKDHKHYVRVIVPIPLGMEKAKNALEAVGQNLKSAFNYLCGDNQRHEEVDLVPQFIKNEIKEDHEAYEYLQQREDLTDDEKDYFWHYYKAVKEAERYGKGYLKGKDLNGNNRYGEVKIVNGVVEIHYAIYEKEVFAQKLTDLVLLQMKEVDNAKTRANLEKQMLNLLDVYNNDDKLNDFNDYLLDHCPEFQQSLGLRQLQEVHDADAPAHLQKVFAPLLGGALGGGIAGGAAGGAAIGNGPPLEGLLFAGPILAKLLYNAKECEVRDLLKDKIAADKLNAADPDGGFKESFPAHTQDGPNIIWTPMPDDKGLNIFVTPEHHVKPQNEIFPEAVKLPDLPGFDISDNQGLNVFEQNLHDPFDVRHKGKILPKEYYNNGDMPWKERLIGRAQKTKTPNHRREIYEDSINKAKSGDYKVIFHNKSWNTVLKYLGHDTIPSGRLIPDSIAVDNEGKLHGLEVQSKSDDFDKLKARLDKARKELPESLQSDGVVKQIKRYDYGKRK